MPNITRPGNSPVAEIPVLSVDVQWDEIFRDSHRTEFGNCLRTYIRPRRWFGGKGREIKAIRVAASVAIPTDGDSARLLLLRVEYADAAAEQYQLPVAFASGAIADGLTSSTPHLVIARVLSVSGGGVLYDASASAAFAKSIFACIAIGASINGDDGRLEGFALPALGRIRGSTETPLEPQISVAEQSNSAVLFGDRFILKSFRRLESGVNPDLEIGRFLSTRSFPHTAALAGGIEYCSEDGTRTSLGILSQFQPDCADGWQYTLDALARFYDHVNAPPGDAMGTLLDDSAALIPATIEQHLGAFIGAAQMLGERTAALHWCLASDETDPAFSPAPFTASDRRSLSRSLREQALEHLSTLRKALPLLPDDVRIAANRVVALVPEILAKLDAVADMKSSAHRLRVHGDFHLGQVLHTGRDFLIIDFEGEPARPLSERRAKHSPLKDVAGMLRSFDYAAHAALFARPEPRDAGRAQLWTHWVSVAFLKAYLAKTQGAAFLPDDPRELAVLLEALLLQKAAYELSYELHNRPAWLRIPLAGILQLMDR